MFERFTPSARDVVTGAVRECERTGDPSVRADHLLRTLLDSTSDRTVYSRARHALERLDVLPRRAEVEAALEAGRRRAGLSDVDSAALAELGIDVDAIVSRVEQTHGVGALAGVGAGAADRPRGSGRIRHRPFSTEAKEVLRGSLREAVEHGDSAIGDEHVLLALTAQPGLVADVLAEYGAAYADVRRALAQDSGAA